MPASPVRPPQTPAWRAPAAVCSGRGSFEVFRRVCYQPVHHRLQRYRAGRRMDYEEAADPEGLAKVVADQIGSPVDYLPVARDGAARAAQMIAELVA